MGNSTFVQALFHSGVRNTQPKLLASIGDYDLAPAKLIDAVNAFARDFRANFRAALWREVALGVTLGNLFSVEVDVALMVCPIDIVVDNDGSKDNEALIEEVVEKLGEKVRIHLPFYIVCTNEFRLQGRKEQ